MSPRRPAPGSPLFVLLIAAILTMSAMTIDINLPAIPATAAAFAVPETMAQLSVSLFFLGFAVGQLFYGSLADRYGRRPILLAGIVAYLLTTVGCALASSIEALLAWRVAQGLAAASGPILGRAIIRDRFEGAEMARITSFAMAAFITAPIIAPSIGALVLALGSWRWIFAFLALYGAILLFLVHRFVEESLQRPDPNALRPGRVLGAWKAVLTEPVSLRFAAVAVLALAMLVVYLVSAAPIFMTDYGLSAGEFGILFAVIALCSAAGSLVNTRLVRLHPLTSIIRGCFVTAAVATALGLSIVGFAIGGAWLLAVPFGVFFFAFAMIVPNATAIAMRPHGSIAGAATSVMGVLQSLIPAAVAALVVAIGGGSATMPLLAMLALALIGLWISRDGRDQATSTPS